MIIGHISDLHVSRFGGHLGGWSSRRAHGSPLGRRDDWKLVERVESWRIERREPTRGRIELRLVDDGEAVQARAGGGADPSRTQRELAARARSRLRFDHARLAAHPPSAAELEDRLAEDPENTNLLFCRVARALEEDAPDWVVISGDVTDDGVGYPLVLSALRHFVARGRLLAVPGNHDIYDSPRFAVPDHARKKRSDKRAEWTRFAGALGLPGSGAWVRPLGDSVLLCGLDSCHPPRIPFSASGKIEEHDLDMVEEQLRALPSGGCRLAMLHHHLVNPPRNAVGRAPVQLGLRLRNARSVYERLRQLEISAVMNGHRHIGYRYHPVNAPLIVASPSSTLGCLSGAPRPYHWRLTVSASGVESVRERFFARGGDVG